MRKVFVTGSKGQLGQCIKSLNNDLVKDLWFDYADADILDITNKKEVETYFKLHKFDYCINCAAYTAVDNAENDQENAYKINVDGVINLVESCKRYNITLIHISTDFVFDGKSYYPYREEDNTNPISVYGKTKLEGEKVIISKLKNYYIIRTSWLYSEYGNNFLKTMLKLANSRPELGVINDQIGTPTYAKDLAEVILKLINEKKTSFGLYHYSNDGVASWYDFAVAIFDLMSINIIVNPIPTESYPTPAARPNYSVLNKSKIKRTFNINTSYWRASLKRCLHSKIKDL